MNGINILLASALALASTISVNAAAMLTDQNGMTLYIFDKDANGSPTCYGQCAKVWPPATVKEGEEAMSGWTMVKRKDGTMQWAYDGKPLYYYAEDKAAGDMNGDGKGGVWHIVSK